MERVERMDNNKKNQLILFHGDKGGTGKSTACMFYEKVLDLSLESNIPLGLPQNLWVRPLKIKSLSTV